MAKIGYLPCFSGYLHKHFPLKNFYQKSSYIEKVKKLLSAFVDSESPSDLKENIGGHEVKPVRPDSNEGKKLIRLCKTNYQIYRIDYGNNPFRIVFAFSNTSRLAYIYVIDTTHATMRGKNR